MTLYSLHIGLVLQQNIADNIEKAIGQLELHNSLGSLKEVIERNWAVNERPTFFCFGLLEAFDIAHLTALAAPRPVRFAKPNERLRKELKNLPELYKCLGTPFDPVGEE